MSKTSIGLKNVVKHRIFNLLFVLGKKRNTIIMESFPDFSCNTYELFRKMKEKRVDEKYTITWLIHDKNSISQCISEGVDYIEMFPVGKVQKLKNYAKRYRARAIITSNAIIPKFTGPSDQLHFYLDHGSQLKDVRINGRRIDIGCDYMISQSTFFNKYHIQQYVISEDKILTTGLPRYDQLFKTYSSLERVFSDLARFKKVICWVPTFRKHFDKKRVDCDVSFKYGIPLLESENDLNELNQALVANNVLLVIKPHPAQDMSELVRMDTDNIRVIYSADLLKNNIQINEFLAQTDAMITDYSSIYYDYLMLNRPIAITLDDYEVYEKQKGFVFDNPNDYLKGYHLFSVQDLVSFISDVGNNQNRYYEECKKINSIISDYFDDKSSDRVLEAILQKLENQKEIYY